MDEIKVSVVFDPGQHRNRFENVRLVPTHVRNFELGRELEANDVPWDDTQPFPLAVFVASFKQQLQSQADSQERFALSNEIADWANQVTPTELTNSIAKSSHTREYHLLGRINLTRIAGN